MSTSIALPGQLLGPSSAYRPGPGVHLHNSQLYSSLLGAIAISQPASAASNPTKGPAKRMTKITAHLPSAAAAGGAATGAGPELPTISVSRHAREVLPQVGNVVLCRVTRITPRQAVVAILVCGETVLEAEWQGVIRVQDVRATEKDRCKIYESFRPGDIVRASVISLGDQSNYYLSTASNEYGVIMAVSEAGNVMYPVSWKEYKDPETGLSEARKVAKPY
ncbi:exosome 3'-_5 exonuclease subunit ski4 (Csl4) [Gnomoniopsis smithogilvyi]|uniref:Exosome 3'->5 exonuclease subunit ski4 (Csl4) n=1 Tax=Gnomoniopsis smithogilvyi TaxID=1191159 RepID=A0A9W8YP96_9PEZI|nr:exosome 3'->5 exonuclease subunit ski4 (Csl4) [Gnomoniopsis smithogilvyi]